MQSVQWWIWREDKEQVLEEVANGLDMFTHAQRN